MSGEFGSFDVGYIHTQVLQHSEDCLKSDHELTKLWGEFFKALHPMMHDLCWSEAGDSHFASVVEGCIRDLPELQKRLDDIKNFVKPYEDVAHNAIREYVDKKREFEGGP